MRVTNEWRVVRQIGDRPHDVHLDRRMVPRVDGEAGENDGAEHHPDQVTGPAPARPVDVASDQQVAQPHPKRTRLNQAGCLLFGFVDLVEGYSSLYS